jgi:hypothetical protein
MRLAVNSRRARAELAAFDIQKQRGVAHETQ